ncbi:MAG: NTP transferase domain-containing protein [Salinibacterium sp.]|nr:NTP transferase domain-containing protein [Salinibacterium sp.]
MVVDAIVLTGGRSSRLGSTPKSELIFDGETLLRRTLRAAGAARCAVVVGPELEGLPAGVLHSREDPPFGGPVAGIAAGMAALTTFSVAASDAVLVLACDMPHIHLAIPLLLHGLAEHPESDGVIAVDTEQRRQPLAATFRTRRLSAVLAARSRAEPLAGMAMFRLLDGLTLIPIPMPARATADVDTWEDARHLGVSRPISSPTTT